MFHRIYCWIHLGQNLLVKDFLLVNSIFLRRHRYWDFLFFNRKLFLRHFWCIYSAFSLEFSHLLIHASFKGLFWTLRVFSRDSPFWLTGMHMSSSVWALWNIRFTPSWLLFEQTWRFLEPFLCIEPSSLWQWHPDFQLLLPPRTLITFFSCSFLTTSYWFGSTSLCHVSETFPH